MNRLADEGTKPGTIRNIFAAFRTALNAGVRLRMIASNPCLGVKPPRMRRQPMLFLMAAEVRTLAEVEKGMSLEEIAEKLNDAGIRTPHGTPKWVGRQSAEIVRLLRLAAARRHAKGATRAAAERVVDSAPRKLRLPGISAVPPARIELAHAV